MVSAPASRSISNPNTSLASMFLAFSPFPLLTLPPSLMTVSGIMLIAFGSDVISRNNHHQCRLRTSSLAPVLEATSSSRRISSPALMLIGPSRNFTWLLGMSLGSNSPVISLPPGRSMTSGMKPNSKAARWTKRSRSPTTSSTQKPMLKTPSITAKVSRAARPDTKPGSAGSVFLARKSSNRTSR